jgi:hypothetical protein
VAGDDLHHRDLGLGPDHPRGQLGEVNHRHAARRQHRRRRAQPLERHPAAVRHLVDRPAQPARPPRRHQPVHPARGLGRQRPALGLGHQPQRQQRVVQLVRIPDNRRDLILGQRDRAGIERPGRLGDVGGDAAA